MLHGPGRRGLTVEGWAELLDAYEATIASFEAAVAAGEEIPTGETWTPPAELPASAPTTDDRDRFQALHARAGACVSWLTIAMVGAGAELDTARRTGVAARAYGRVEGLA